MLVTSRSTVFCTPPAPRETTASHVCFHVQCTRLPLLLSVVEVVWEPARQLGPRLKRLMVTAEKSITSNMFHRFEIGLYFGLLSSNGLSVLQGYAWPKVPPRMLGLYEPPRPVRKQPIDSDVTNWEPLDLPKLSVTFYFHT